MRLRIGSGFGIPVYVHWTFFLLPLWVLWQRDDTPMDLPVGLTVLLLSFACIVLHEFGHALMARRFGIGTEDVTLYPIGGVARLQRMTDIPLQEFLIAVAGPAVNVAIAIVLGAVVVPLAIMAPSLIWHTFAGNVAYWVLVINIFLVPFNLLPAFPMDGGRVLRAVLSHWLGHLQGTQVAVYIGVAMAILLGLVGLAIGGLLPVIAIFIIFAGQQELAAVRMQEERRRRWEEEEPLEVLPARPRDSAAPVTPLMYQPTISVYTWDSHTGTWRGEPGAPV